MQMLTEDTTVAVNRLSKLLDKFGVAEVPPITSPDSKLDELLLKLPLRDKRSLVEHRRAHAARYLTDTILFSETSGTTNIPLQIPRNESDLVHGVRNYAKIYSQFLFSKQDRVAIIHHSILSPFRELSVRALQDLNIGSLTVFPIPVVCSYGRVHSILSRSEITALVGTPSLVLQMLYNWHQEDLTLPLSVRQIFLTGEPFTLADAANLSRLVHPGCKIAPLMYGASEVGAMMLARPDFTYAPLLHDFIFELIPVENSHECWDSSRNTKMIGRLVVTALIDSLIPILRFDTKDIFALEMDRRGGIFEYIGRNRDFPITLRQRNLVSEVVMTMEKPAYHFDAAFSIREGKLSVYPVCAGGISGREKQMLRERLNSALDNKIVVEVGDELDGSQFLAEACYTKIDRFRVVE